jgi:hypothetical protein
VTPWQLITPGLVPGDLPEVISDPGEKRLLMAFRDRRRMDRPSGETAH